MSDNDPTPEQTPVTPAPAITPEPDSTVDRPFPSIDGVSKVPASKIPNKTIPKSATEDNKASNVHTLSQQKTNGISLVIAVTAIFIVAIAGLVIFAYIKSK
jgi:hypothetical protein